MTLQRVAAWGLLGLGLWAGAAPVKMVDDKAGITRITDKATGEAVYMSADTLRYSVGGKAKWEKRIKDLKPLIKNGHFLDILLSESGIFVGISQTPDTVKAIQFFKSGRLGWKLPTDSYQFRIHKHWPINKVFGYNECHDGAIIQCNDFIINEITGKSLKMTGKIVGESKGLLYLQTEDLEGVTDLDLRYKLFTEGIQKISYKIYTLNGKLIPSAFYTPPRQNCGDYQPKIEEIANSNGFTKPEYGENIVKGEYIYAHRADGCGKFTYKFHWTDPKNPAPQILQGWK